jgi:hypothetical protein
MAPEMNNLEYVDTNEALDIIKNEGTSPVSLPTLINWIRNYKIGKKVGGRWRVNKQKLIEMLREGNPNGTT